MKLSRREFIKLTSIGAATLAAPWALEACGDGTVQFFTAHERATVEAAAARIVPSDQEPGAAEAKAARYIEHLLSAFDHDPPLIFGGGPFSGRQPFPANGAPSDRFPKNRFERFLPLSRVREIAWRMRVYGSAATPGGDFNDAALGATKGWRDLYRAGLAALDAKSRELFSKDFIDLTAEQQDEALKESESGFVNVLTEHVLEGTYAAPEYGGNDGLVMWNALGHRGDSQPLGYSIYNEETEQLEELADRPLSTANPDEDFAGMDAEATEFVSNIVTAIGGERFF
jgi:gluconate 2-dehydrogenase gamma chain